MAKLGGEADLAEEALGAERQPDFGEKHLDGHRALVAEVPGLVDQSHPPASQLALEKVAARESLLERARQWQSQDSQEDPKPNLSGRRDTR